MLEPDGAEWSKTLADLRIRYDALRLSDDEEVMSMLVAAVCQLAHREETHPAAILFTFAEQIKRLWGERWGMFVHDMLEADDP